VRPASEYAGPRLLLLRTFRRGEFAKGFEVTAAADRAVRGGDADPGAAVICLGRWGNSPTSKLGMFQQFLSDHEHVFAFFFLRVALHLIPNMLFKIVPGMQVRRAPCLMRETAVGVGEAATVEPAVHACGQMRGQRRRAARDGGQGEVLPATSLWRGHVRSSAERGKPCIPACRRRTFG